MKILAIRGRNLASLAGDFAIDFEHEPLKSAGLFAICGPTGAGKSTLLDALCMALYEKTPRLHKAGGIGLPDVGDSMVTQQDARNLLRRGTADGYAEVDFIGHDGIGYRARWSVRRARGKADGSLQKTGMSLKQLPELQPIGGTNKEVLAEIAQRLGLSFDQFTRAVLLAQNEFSTFLKADDNERGELLETLTGSAIYSVLSQRAYARAKHEQQELQRLADRLADQKPLADDVRLQLQQDSTVADAAVAALERRQVILDAQWRWYQDERKFRESEQLAAAQLQQQQAAQRSAGGRRTVLQQVESVQAARPLLAEIERLGGALAADHHAIDECRLKLADTAHARQQADGALEAAQRELQHAEQARANAAPALDQAKALDARIDTLLPAQQQARQAHADALQAAGQALQKRQAKEAELAGAQQQQQATETWLAQHAALRTLSENWPRWDILLKQASISRSEAARLNDILEVILKTETMQRALVGTATAAQAGAASVLATAVHQRRHATQHHANIDLSALQMRKHSAESRREHLSSAEQCWRTLAELQARRQALAVEAEHSRQALAQATTAQVQIDSQLPALAAALEQAGRSLKSAEAACAENVESLRATLQADLPCPVCGATVHPYTTEHPQMRAMLASLQAQVQDCRSQQQQAQQQQAAHNAEAASQRRRLEVLAQEQQQLDSAIVQRQQQWQAQWAPTDQSRGAADLVAAGLPAGFDNLDTALQARWFASERASVQAQLHEIGQIEDAWRRAALAKDAAQAEFERATAEHDASKEAASAVQAALAETSARQRAATEQLAQCRQRLDDSLLQLDAAFTTAGADDAATHQAGQSGLSGEAGWKARWQASPAAFHAECARQAAQWQSQCDAFEQGRQRHATLTLELAGLVEAHVKAGIEQQRAATASAASDTGLADMQARRRMLFNGEPVQQVEAQLAATIADAQAALVRHTATSNDRKQAHIRSTEALEQAQRQLANHSSEARASATQLADWIHRFNLAQLAAARRLPEVQAVHAAPAAQIECESLDETGGNGEDDKIASATALLDEDRLRALLAHSADWISTERAALHAIDQAAHHAATVLEERSSQRRAHQQQRPPADDHASDSAAAGNSPHAAPGGGAQASAIVCPEGADTDTDASGNRIAELRQALDRLAIERQGAHAHATELQLALAQDQARRTQAANMLATIATQEASYRLWAQLNDLIGAADGKKFRNVAQQTTLDVLLGYANRHLHELSRRYRLQRIAGTLALMVIDQDMGDELRSVHSLSGGESFLVSLALALGLASLSSNRVRVESLFIDEGFGSLDADTLRVAMDALDGLQAMGRKVGVISHVQEMTERIATKVLVQRTAGGRSLVEVG